jgi:electron transfer flavoprotein alpha subunit
MAAYTFATEPCMVTLRSRVEEAATRQDEANAVITSIEVKLDVSAAAAEVMQRVIEEDDGVNLTDAEIIVSGSRRIGGTEGFEQLAQLAEVLGAAVGASRPPCDLGWAPSKAQVRQTGEKVAPSLYSAVGISGATSTSPACRARRGLLPSTRIRRPTSCGSPITGLWATMRKWFLLSKKRSQRYANSERSA